jgi:hypothetical protein
MAATAAGVSGWPDVADELARWREAGLSARLWWRDDDAADDEPALDRLFSLRREVQVPLALAVVPARATPALAACLAGEPEVDLLQHGYAHTNHAGPAEKNKCELGLQRPAMQVLGELATGWLALERLFGKRPLAVLVPPWNRIAPALLPALPEIGFAGLSTFANRPSAEPVKGLRQVNTHVDLVDWRGGRGFVGEQAGLAALVKALANSRAAGTAEPIGILSHHLAMDEGAWDFLRSFWGRANEMPGVQTCAAHELFASGEARV